MGIASNYRQARKYSVLISQLAWLYQALSDVSINKIVLWINVRADDWTAESSIIAGNELFSFLASHPHRLLQKLLIVYIMIYVMVKFIDFSELFQ